MAVSCSARASVKSSRRLPSQNLLLETRCCWVGAGRMLACVVACFACQLAAPRRYDVKQVAWRAHGLLVNDGVTMALEIFIWLLVRLASSYAWTTAALVCAEIKSGPLPIGPVALTGGTDGYGQRWT